MFKTLFMPTEVWQAVVLFVVVYTIYYYVVTKLWQAFENRNKK